MSQKSDVKIRAARAEDMTRLLELIKSATSFHKLPAGNVTTTPEQLQKEGGFLRLMIRRFLKRFSLKRKLMAS